MLKETSLSEIRFRTKQDSSDLNDYDTTNYVVEGREGVENTSDGEPVILSKAYQFVTIKVTQFDYVVAEILAKRSQRLSR